MKIIVSDKFDKKEKENILSFFNFKFTYHLKKNEKERKITYLKEMIKWYSFQIERIKNSTYWDENLYLQYLEEPNYLKITWQNEIAKEKPQFLRLLKIANKNYFEITKLQHELNKYEKLN